MEDIELTHAVSSVIYLILNALLSIHKLIGHFGHEASLCYIYETYLLGSQMFQSKVQCYGSTQKLFCLLICLHI